jgi:hypothetical protein
MLNDIAAFVILVVAMYDVFLVSAGLKTISRRYQELFPAWVDIAILVPVAVGICFLPVYPFIKVALGITAGHVFWSNRERWTSK